MILFHGLGATYTNVKQPGASAMAPESGTSQTATTGDYLIHEYTFYDIAVERGAAQQPTAEEAAAKTALYQTNLMALALSLPPCVGDESYFDAVSPITREGDNIGLLAPGTFEMLGVVFTIADYKDGKFSSSFMPSEYQRKQIELAIITGSQVRLFGKENSVMNPNKRYIIGEGRLYWRLEKLNGWNNWDVPIEVWKRMGVKVNAEGQIAEEFPAAKEWSVDAMLAFDPDLVLWWPNFKRNPIHPTIEERTQRGGWAAWLARGGYPLSREILRGKASVYYTQDFNTIGAGDTSQAEVPVTFCGSMPCAETRKDGTVRPSCFPMQFGESGPVAYNPKSQEKGFKVYVGIPYRGTGLPGTKLFTVGDGEDPPLDHNTISYSAPFNVVLVHQKFSTLEKIVGAVGDALDTLKNLLCKGGPAVLNKMAAPVCLNQMKKPCQAGTPGCVCAPGPMAVQASVAQVGVAIACSGTPPVPPQLPIVIEPPPPPPCGPDTVFNPTTGICDPVGLTTIQKVLIGMGVLGGLALLLRR